MRASVDELGDEAKDEQIFALIADKGWFLVTLDRHMKWNRVQKRAILRQGCGVFILKGKRRGRTVPEIVRFFIDRWPMIEGLARETALPYYLADRRKGEARAMVVGRGSSKMSPSVVPA